MNEIMNEKKYYSHFLFKKEFQLVNISDLEALDVDVVNPTVLKDSGLIKFAMRPVKVLGAGELTKKIDVSASAFSKTAEEKIKKAGGSFTEQ